MKYFNAMRYGDRETKLYLWSVFLGTLFTVLAVAFTVWKRSWVGGLVALFFGVVTLIIWQSKNLTDDEIEREGKGEKEVEEKIEKREKEKEQKAEQEEREEKKEERKETEEKKEQNEKQGARKEKKKEQERKEREKRNEKATNEKQTEEETSDEKKTEEAELKEESENNSEKEDPEEEKGTDYETYSEPVLKKAMHRYRVKREHRPVMIDSCRSKKIRECPAYLWKDRHKAYLLLLEKTPRRIEYPLERMNFLEYRRGVAANPDKEYRAFRKNSPVTSVFQSFLPSYYQRRKNGVISDRKNLYVMAGDLAFTNTSVKNVMAVLHPGFRVKDNVTTSSHYGAYFIESYQQHILLQDGVLEVEEYKERMKVLLKEMAKEAASLNDLRKKLEELVEYRLITDELADYFMEYRARRELAALKQEKKKTENN